MEKYLKLCSQINSLMVLKREDVTVPETLNRKTFIQLVHFLVKCIQPDNKKFNLMASDKTSEAKFINDVFKEMCQWKKDYPHVYIPHIQQSHFIDPRANNPKVTDFLQCLVVLATQCHYEKLHSNIKLSKNRFFFKEDIINLEKAVQEKKLHYEKTSAKVNEMKMLLIKEEELTKNQPQELKKIQRNILSTLEGCIDATPEGLLQLYYDKRKELCDSIACVAGKNINDINET